MKKITKFFSEVKKELSKVKWPSRKDMVKYSIATIAMVLVFALLFYAVGAIVATVVKMV